jgi:hypothetical protein
VETTARGSLWRGLKLSKLVASWHRDEAAY